MFKKEPFLELVETIGAGAIKLKEKLAGDASEFRDGESAAIETSVLLNASMEVYRESFRLQQVEQLMQQQQHAAQLNPQSPLAPYATAMGMPSFFAVSRGERVSELEAMRRAKPDAGSWEVIEGNLDLGVITSEAEAGRKFVLVFLAGTDTELARGYQAGFCHSPSFVSRNSARCCTVRLNAPKGVLLQVERDEVENDHSAKTAARS